MEPDKSRGLVVSYTPPDPVVSTTPGSSDNTAIISQVSPPQHNSSQNQVITKTVTSSTGKRVTTSTTTTTTTTSKLTEVVQNKPFKIQTLFTRDIFRPKVSPKPQVAHITLEYYLEYISNERLRRMPSRGSAWDRVLHAAQFFGFHMSDFADKINTVVNAGMPNTLSQEVRADNLARKCSGQEALSNGQNDNVSINGTADLTTTALTATHSLLEVCLKDYKHQHSHTKQLLI